MLALAIICQSLRLGSQQLAGNMPIYSLRQSKMDHFQMKSLNRLSNSRSLALRMGLFDGLKNAVGGGTPVERLKQENDQLFQSYSKNVEKINALESEYEKFSNEALATKTEELKRKIRSSKNPQQALDSLLVEAFSVVREASWRVLEMRHFDVQLIGGMALHDGKLAEMATGEGKTLVAILPIYLNALTGDGSFVVTTNDYLASRDGEMMGQVFRFLGLSVGIVQSYQKEAQRKQAYSCDVTYVSNQELGFDYLRDNLAMSKYFTTTFTKPLAEPPRIISVPRPAMFVATVTEPTRPA